MSIEQSVNEPVVQADYDDVCDDNSIDNIYEDIMQIESEEHTIESGRQSKRLREEESEEAWTQVKNRRERIKDIRGIVEISITSTEKFPKQFALAKLFKSQNITEISRVKYINPYKIIIEMKGEENAENLLKCDHLINLGWRFQRPLEVGLSYGVIKNIELELAEKDLIESITSTCEIANVKRLKRRADVEVGWVDSESVRVGFRGPLLPAYIYIYDMQVRVEPYLFPVTQCSRCWRFGHTIRMCPSKRVYCPKCGGKHENCDTTTYKCLNCTKNHMTLNRKCPEYIKEKKMREIMAEFNVSYRKAITMYVPLQPPTRERSRSPIRAESIRGVTPNTTLRFSTASLPTQEAPTYAHAASSSGIKKNMKNHKKRHRMNGKR